mgnify:CR=1 FL=1|jgi:hypothetical protein
MKNIKKMNLRKLIISVPSLVFLLNIIIFVGCGNDNEPDTPEPPKEENSAPEISTLPISDITESSAVSGGNITKWGETVTKRGVVWSSSGTPTIDDFKTEDGKEGGKFTSLIENLQPETEYKVRAYAINDIGISYGDELNFKTEGSTNNNHEPPFDALIDVIFNEDGTAKDNASKKDVETIEGPQLTTVYDENFNRYLARFAHLPGKVDNGFYKIDYQDDDSFKQNFVNNGFTIEVVFSLNAEEPYPSELMAIFNAREKGGAGILTRSTENTITFISRTEESGYVWTDSKIKPEKGKYYHCVGIYDARSETANIYVNGEIEATEEAKGNFVFSSTEWFGIGVRPSHFESGENGWYGDVVIARIYDSAFRENEVKTLWENIEKPIIAANTK